MYFGVIITLFIFKNIFLDLKLGGKGRPPAGAEIGVITFSENSKEKAFPNTFPWNPSFAIERELLGHL